MASDKIYIMDGDEIQLILERMAYQVLEFFYGLDEIYMLGIEEGGLLIAQELKKYIEKESDQKIYLQEYKINKQKPLESPEIDSSIFENQNILIVDDVANSGKTLAYALRPLLNTYPRQIKIAVLVDRKHKQYPISADIVGRKLSTNIQDTIKVEFDKKGQPSGAYLTDGK